MNPEQIDALIGAVIVLSNAAWIFAVAYNHGRISKIEGVMNGQLSGKAGAVVPPVDPKDTV